MLGRLGHTVGTLIDANRLRHVLTLNYGASVASAYLDYVQEAVVHTVVRELLVADARVIALREDLQAQGALI